MRQAHPELAESSVEQLAHFQTFLLRWNQTWNLTAITSPQEAISHHLSDSLSIQTWLNSDHLADIGSGGGLPAIPLAIVNPERQFTLIESSQKKVNFLRQAAIELSLDNVTAIHSRVEDYRADTLFGQISSRAFASIPDFIEGSRHLLAADGEWLAMKGHLPEAELAALADKFEYTVRPLSVPDLDATRHLIVIKNN